MNKIKVKLDRETLSSDYIESKQDFKQVTSQVHASAKILKSTWFYGAIGLASLATIVTLSVKTSQNSLNEENSTLKTSITTAGFVNTSPTVQISKKETVDSPIVEQKANSAIVQQKPNQKPKATATVTPKPVEAREKIDVQEIKEVETVKTTVRIPIPPKIEEAKKNYMPKIGGVYDGDIYIRQLCGNGIEVNSDIEITSFTLSYSTNRGDKTLKVNGNKVPANICNEMYSYGIDQMIYINDIIGEDLEGKVLRFVPMNLTAVID